MDLYFTEEGDLQIANSGDLAVTESMWRDDLQQAYIRIMTDIGEYELYPQMGSDLSDLIGRPQSPKTGAYGKSLIQSALDREGRFNGRTYKINAVPTGPQSIRFDVKLRSQRGIQETTISVEQQLGI